ncbi:MAG: hypothetical protein LBV58_03575 [Acholeplasmatales bacterium]|jgi:heat-inducible transcriptional repressor|nr:hypothetical protein [Acholeplasmatales bacterium]
MKYKVDLNNAQTKLLKEIVENYVKSGNYSNTQSIYDIKKKLGLSFQQIDQEIENLVKIEKILDEITIDGVKYYSITDTGLELYIKELASPTKELDRKIKDIIFKKIISKSIKDKKITIKDVYSDEYEPLTVHESVNTLFKEGFIRYEGDYIEPTERGYKNYIECFTETREPSVRQKMLLKGIIEILNDSIDDKPLGSKTLLELLGTEVSGATMRYDLAALEESGYLEKIQTSSGRLPSKEGYLYYYKNLMEHNISSNDEFLVIDEIFETSEIKKDAISKALNYISKITDSALIYFENKRKNEIEKFILEKLENGSYSLIALYSNGTVNSKLINFKNLEEKMVLLSLLSDIGNKYTDKGVYHIESYSKNVLKEKIYSYFKALEEADDRYLVSGILNVFGKSKFMKDKKVNDVYEFINDRKQVREKLEDLSGLIFGDDLDNTLSGSTLIVVPILDQYDNKEIGKLSLICPEKIKFKAKFILDYLAILIAKREV